MYIIEGNIGAGKSTFLRLLEQEISSIKAVPEQVNNWQQSLYGQSILTNFYEDPVRWAYTFETLTMMSRVQDYLQNQTHSCSAQVVERSVYSGYYCFAYNSHTQGFLSDIEWEMYQQWFSMLIPNKCKAPRGFIYLRVCPEVAYERIRKRNRHAEKTMSRTYLKQIHQRHEQIFAKKEGILPFLKKVPVLILECNEDFESSPEQFKKHIDQVQAFFIQTGGIPAKSEKIPHVPVSSTVI